MTDWIEPAVNIVFVAFVWALLIEDPGQGDLEAYL